MDVTLYIYINIYIERDVILRLSHVIRKYPTASKVASEISGLHEVALTFRQNGLSLRCQSEFLILMSQYRECVTILELQRRMSDSRKRDSGNLRIRHENPTIQKSRKILENFDI